MGNRYGELGARVRGNVMNSDLLALAYRPKASQSQPPEAGLSLAKEVAWSGLWLWLWI